MPMLYSQTNPPSTSDEVALRSLMKSDGIALRIRALDDADRIVVTDPTLTGMAREIATRKRPRGQS
jgi:hypothetical protein